MQEGVGILWISGRLLCRFPQQRENFPEGRIVPDKVIGFSGFQCFQPVVAPVVSVVPPYAFCCQSPYRRAQGKCAVHLGNRVEMYCHFRSLLHIEQGINTILSSGINPSHVPVGTFQILGVKEEVPVREEHPEHFCTSIRFRGAPPVPAVYRIAAERTTEQTDTGLKVRLGFYKGQYLQRRNLSLCFQKKSKYDRVFSSSHQFFSRTGEESRSSTHASGRASRKGEWVAMIS